MIYTWIWIQIGPISWIRTKIQFSYICATEPVSESMFKKGGTESIF